jgi:hypothetical protein
MEALCPPERDGVLIAELGGVSEGFDVIFVLGIPLDVHVAGIPIAITDGRGGPPVRPYSELGIAKPLRTRILHERGIMGRERPGLNDNSLGEDAF